MSSGPRRCGSRRPAAVRDNTTNGYVETDPTGRYGRFDELLGKGAMKSVYRGFDEERGVEVAWNQASLSDVLRTPNAVERMYSEVQLLSTLHHDAIIGFHASWLDVPCRTFNFITELFSSGTLRSYRLRYPRVSLRAVRSWARQILRGLAYLHAHDPPVIHRDLKCDNIFVNGNQGQVKIGDLGLATMLREAGQVAHTVVGTPEFMAPEMYDEEYDERVDVYSFGMCMLEMLTVEYPYSECSNPAQIYKKVAAGKLPDAFYRVQDDGARGFIGRCLAKASTRPSAADLLLDPFLLDDHHQQDSSASTMTIGSVMTPSSLLPIAAPCSSTCNSSSEDVSSPLGDDRDDMEENAPRADMTITGKLNTEEDTIFLKVQIADETGNTMRNIYFPFDLVSDTAMEVAQEMVKELNITDREPSEIAAMIDQEIQRLLPEREQQHEYIYATHDDDDENEERPPSFYYLSSSPTSSQGSLCGVRTYTSSGFSGSHDSGWSKDNGYYALLSDDDDVSSMHSGKYSALHYASGHEEEEAASGQAKKNTRFGPAAGESSSRSPRRADTAQQQFINSSSSLLARQLQRQCSGMSPHAGRPRRREDGRRMARNRSMVDMRSQLLHRTLVEELNRRLFFNTVGAVENIGFRDPITTTNSSSSSSARGRSSKDGKHHHHHQYVML